MSSITILTERHVKSFYGRKYIEFDSFMQAVPTRHTWIDRYVRIARKAIINLPRDYIRSFIGDLIQ